MIKKFVIPVLFLTSCANIDKPSQKIEYIEKDGGCMYVEYFGLYGDSLFNTKEVFNVKRRNSIMYPKTSCNTVIEADLKSGNNKNIIK